MEKLHVCNTSYGTVNPMIEKKEIPKVFLCISSIKLLLHVTMHEVPNGSSEAENIK
jgi:hypothetical protein